jgi:hypothetical protein
MDTCGKNLRVHGISGVMAEVNATDVLSEHRLGTESELKTVKAKGMGGWFHAWLAEVQQRKGLTNCLVVAFDN